MIRYRLLKLSGRRDKNPNKKHDMELEKLLHEFEDFAGKVESYYKEENRWSCRVRLSDLEDLYENIYRDLYEQHWAEWAEEKIWKERSNV